MKKLNFLREKYPQFVYDNYFYRVSGKNLEIFFIFRINPGIYFKPKIVIENIDKKRVIRIGDRELNNLIFHLGLMEIPSYWKTTCSPEIIIKAGPLNKEQINWWKDLIIQGMGQFFYENKINWRSPNFLKIKSRSNEICKRFDKGLKNRYLVPVGWGKDSIVTLESLKKQKKEINSFSVNPTKITKKTLMVAGIKKPIIVKRTLDYSLLELNKKGYLNGHTPFTAVLSFLAVFSAVLFDYKNIAFSNEKSADEGNVKYLGKIINHQYAKSSRFEKKFKEYCKKYLAKNINYFSYLRPYTELEISKRFVKYPQYFSIFSSCNVVVAKKLKKKWCGKCPKCLFVYATLYPFLEKKQILKIFGEDFFEKKELLPLMKSLTEPKKRKPFECVGTKKESKMAFELSLKKARKSGKIPYLLKNV